MRQASYSVSGKQFVEIARVADECKISRSELIRKAWDEYYIRRRRVERDIFDAQQVAIAEVGAREALQTWEAKMKAKEQDAMAAMAVGAESEQQTNEGP